MFEIAEAEPAKFLLDGDAVEPERAHFGPQMAGEGIVGVDRCRDRRDPVAGETPRRLSDHVGGLAE